MIQVDHTRTPLLENLLRQALAAESLENYPRAKLAWEIASRQALKDGRRAESDYCTKRAKKCWELDQLEERKVSP